MISTVQFHSSNSKIGTSMRGAKRALAVAIMSAFLATSLVQAQTYTVLYSFTGGADGAGPTAALLQDAAGNLYGTTQYGGSFGSGVVFKIDASGNETVLHSFTGGSDGAYPAAALLQDAAGSLYGTTQYGGSFGDGVVFKIDASGNETLLHSFGRKWDGAVPFAGLIRDASGNLYGTTESTGRSGGGVVFKINASGKERVLHNFVGLQGGLFPFAGLIQDTAGNLYGTTTGGGKVECGSPRLRVPCGVVFKLDKTGKETVLYSFAGDGAFPYAGLVRDAAGNLYGTTAGGGSYDRGTVFGVDQSGNKTLQYSFTGGADGANPVASLIMDAKGNLYGTTRYGGGGTGCVGRYGCGVVFKLDTTGKETVLYSFTGGADGANPAAGLIRDNNGNLYGTTVGGGASGYGVVFKLTP